MTVISNEPAPATRLLTSDLFREVSATGPSDDLIAVGLALHHFTELVRDLVPIEPLQLHRATTVLTKQVATALGEEHPLETVHTLVTDPDRCAAPDRRTAAQLCGEAWPRIRDLADHRARCAIDGADTFGEATVLHLAATRAVKPRCVWWGTHGWTKRVDDWSRRFDASGRRRPVLVSAPEYVDDDVLAQIVDVSGLVSDADPALVTPS